MAARRSGRKCTVCSRRDVQTVNKRLVKPGASIRRIAAEIGVAESNLGRHFRNHVPKLVKAATKAVEAQGFDILGWIESDREAIEEVRERARKRTVLKRTGEKDEDGRPVYEEFVEPDDRLILESVRASAKLAEVAAKVQGDIPAGETGEVKVVLSMNERAEEA